MPRIIKKELLEFKYSWKELIEAFWFLLGLTGIRRRYLVAAIFLFIILFYTVVPPLIIGSVVNFFTHYKAGQSFSPFYFLAVLLGGSMLIIAIIRLTIKQRLGLLQNTAAYQIKVKGFELLLSQSLIETSKTATGEKVQKIQNGIDAFYNFSSLLTNQILYSAAAMAGIISIFLYIKYIYAVFFLIYIVIFFIMLKIFTKRLTKLNFERYDAMEKASGAYVEGLSNISTLKSLGSEKHFQTRIIERENLFKVFSDKMTKTGTNQWKIFQIFNGLSAGAFLLFIGGDVLAGVINIGEIVIFYSYLEKTTSIADQIMNIYSNLIQSKAGIGRMMEIFQHGRLNNEAGHSQFPASWEKVSISGGGFLYESGAGVKNINIEVKKGEKIGVVGKTGSGKSTLAKILLGLYPLEKGEYKIGDNDFYSIKSDEIFENISVIPQEIEMFNMSFIENITLFKNVDPSLLEKAIETAQLREVIDALPQGLDTIIGEKGYRLSGGERQRLAIARAICQSSQILILDEATSSLDFRTESLIYGALEENFPDKTIIAIAHRIKTLENTNKIYVFEKGEIVEIGKYYELINDKNSFLYGISQKGV